MCSSPKSRPFIKAAPPRPVLSHDTSLQACALPLPQFHRIVAGLMLVGMASGRTVLFPDIPCECW